MTIVQHFRPDDKTPSLGTPIRFASDFIDQGLIDDYADVTTIGLYTPIDPDFVQRLLAQKIRYLWIFEKRLTPQGWQNIRARYLLDIEQYLRWLAVSAQLGHPWLVEDGAGDEWLLVPIHLLERRRYTKNGSKLPKSKRGAR